MARFCAAIRLMPYNTDLAGAPRSASEARSCEKELGLLRRDQVNVGEAVFERSPRLTAPLAMATTSGARASAAPPSAAPAAPRLRPAPPRRGAAVACLPPPRPFRPATGGDARADAAPPPHAALLEAPTAPTEPAAARPEAFEAWRVRALLARLRAAGGPAARLRLLRAQPMVAAFLRAGREGAALAEALDALPPYEAYLLALLPALGQPHVLRPLPPGVAPAAALAALAAALAPVDDFYGALGGLPGYQLQCLEFLAAGAGAEAAPAPARAAAAAAEFLPPPGLSLVDPAHAGAVAAATAAGVAAQPALAEIWPLGGAGDRLGLRCEATGEALPTAVLPYCGRPLLAALVRDLQARERLHWRLHGAQPATPVAVMTSGAKGNHARVAALLAGARWHGRGRAGFRLFQQPLVPVVAAAGGAWLLAGPGAPLLRPGGHGAVWKLMLDAGIFSWLRGRGATGALVRQISNPMAGQDATLLALAGAGLGGGRAFGFAACERAPGAAEGLNVLACGPGGWRVTCVEYTEVERAGLGGAAAAALPANANVLYVGLAAAEAAVAVGAAAGDAAATLPGLLLNARKAVTAWDPATRRVGPAFGGRLEATMQNLADAFPTPAAAPPATPAAAAALATFVLHGPRRRVTSSAKRRRAPGSAALAQTPDGSFLDLQANAAELLARAGVAVPRVPAAAEFLAAGPSFVFLYHPALGPLWDVISQKVRGGRLGRHAELVLELAEAALEEVDVEGSLLIEADAPLGHEVDDAGGDADGARLVFSDRCGRARLARVRVRNAGVDWAAPLNEWWRHRVARREACRVRLRGAAEFDAADVELSGDLEFDVPDGHRLLVRPTGPGGAPEATLERLDGAGPSWRWAHALDAANAVRLTLVEAEAP